MVAVEQEGLSVDLHLFLCILDQPLWLSHVSGTAHALCTPAGNGGRDNWAEFPHL